MTRQLLIFCLGLTTLLTSVLAAAQMIEPIDVTTEHKLDLNQATYVLDKNNITSIKQAANQSDIHWHPLQDPDTKMIGAHNLWVQIKLTTTQPNIKRILEINNPHIDKIEIFRFANQQLVDVTTLGDQQAFSERLLNAKAFYYPISLTEGQVQQLFIKIDTEGSAHLPLTLWSKQGLLEEKENQVLIDGLHLGLLVGIGCFSLFFAFATRSFSYGYYSGYVLTMAVVIATLNGYAFQYLWPQWPILQQFMIPLCVPIALAFTLMLTEKILHLRTENLNMLRFCRMGALFSVALSLTSPFINYEFALLMQLNIVLTVCIALMILTCIQAYRGHKLARLYAVGLGMIVTAATLSILSYLGLISFNFQPQQPLMIGITAEITVMSIILAIRYNDERQEKLRIQQKALVQAERIRKARENELTAETRSNAKLERMVQERTLELEMAYRELNSAHDQLKEQTSIDTLTGVKNRSTFDKRLVAESKLSRRQMTPLALMMIDIDRFKLINDTYGHLAGDIALKSIAEAIQGELKRPSDIVARFGGEEFAIILPTTDIEGALTVADNIRRRIKSLQIEWQQQRISLTVSIGVSATVIQDNDHAMSLLDEADKALYQAKANGRDQVQEYLAQFTIAGVSSES